MTRVVRVGVVTCNPADLRFWSFIVIGRAMFLMSGPSMSKPALALSEISVM